MKNRTGLKISIVVTGIALGALIRGPSPKAELIWLTDYRGTYYSASGFSHYVIDEPVERHYQHARDYARDAGYQVMMRSPTELMVLDGEGLAVVIVQTGSRRIGFNGKGLPYPEREPGSPGTTIIVPNPHPGTLELTRRHWVSHLPGGHAFVPGYGAAPRNGVTVTDIRGPG